MAEFSHPVERARHDKVRDEIDKAKCVHCNRQGMSFGTPPQDSDTRDQTDYP